MKCIINKKTLEISRVSDEQAEAFVESGSHEYSPKSLWKTQEAQKERKR